MRIREVTWLEEVADKIVRKHGLWPHEAEEVLLARPHVRFLEKGHVPGEDLFGGFGRTAAGRHVVVYFLLKKPETALVVTAREMTRREKRRYGKRQG